MQKRYVQLPLLRKRTTVLCSDDIVYLEADQNMSLLYLMGTANPLSINENLANIEQLIDRNDFVRIHRSIIVNLKYVLDYGKYPDKHIKLSTGLFLPIARRRKLEFHNYCIKYFKQQNSTE
jgi:two-component system LytT family response regulator